jgi:hypothetical protein
MFEKLQFSVGIRRQMSFAFLLLYSMVCYCRSLVRITSMSLYPFDVRWYLKVRHILWVDDGFVFLSIYVVIWASLFCLYFVRVKTVKENDQWLPSTVIVPEDLQKPPPGTRSDEMKTVPATSAYFLSYPLQPFIGHNVGTYKFNFFCVCYVDSVYYS